MGSKLIYILGSGHCGSTLLDVILGSHSKIAGVGELVEICRDNYSGICACQKKVSECFFWQCVNKNTPELKQSDLTDLDLHTNKLDFILRKSKKIKTVNSQVIDYNQYLDINQKLYKAVADCSGKNVIVDSSKNPNRAELLAKSRLFQIILIHIIRDGRGVTCSYKRKRGKALESTLRWCLRNLKIEITKVRNKSVPSLTIRYEDFIKNPKNKLEEILKLVGLDYEPQMLNFSGVEHHQINGNRMRFQKNNDIQEDLSWKTELTKKDLFIFNLFAGWLNKIYGY